MKRAIHQRGQRVRRRGWSAGVVVSLFLIGFACRGVWAQEATPKARVSKAPQSLADLPPEVRLGVRLEGVRRKLPVARTLVVTPDAGAYLDAINRWTPNVRFPVLIDDGSDAARQRLASFVRAFKPKSVVLWAGDGSHDLTVAESIRDRTNKIDDVVARAWGAESHNDIFKQWKLLGLAPPGVVVASLLDRAWPAAVALAAGRGQPILWLAKPPTGRLGAVMDAPALAQFDQTITGALDALGLPWKDKGDAVESVTICLTMPTKIPGPNGNLKEPLSLTDRIGRHADSTRWGWSAILFGDESESSWRAMCALFLQPTRAWLFDGYRDKPPFNTYRLGAAAERLTKIGLTVTADSAPDSSMLAWRTRSRLGMDAGLIHVNSSGSRRRFNLNPGRPYASDTPILWTPAIVHFIESFSAQNLDDRRSIARLWLDRGAYAYVGAVHEPFLQAFQTPDALTQRLLAPTTFAIAASKEMGHVWRLLTIGDPLITLGPPAPVADMPELEGATSLETHMREALKNKHFDKGIADLTMLGRDADAARLVRALVEDKPEVVTPALARLGWRPVLRTGQISLLLTLIDSMDQKERTNPELTDLLWIALRPELSFGEQRAVAVLQSRLRHESFGEDVIDLALAIRKSKDVKSARGWLAAMIKQAPNDRTRKKIEEALRRYH